MITTDLKILRAPNEMVKPDEVADLITLLETELANSARLGRDGVGLAAPQVGLNKRAAIIRLKTPHQDIKLNLANCRIENSYDPQRFEGEGCLSIPGQTFDTMRYQEVHVVDNLVAPYSFIATGLLSVIVQHELDHLDGILASDRAIKKPNPVLANVGPNDPCFCGSNTKFKKCCGRNT